MNTSAENYLEDDSDRAHRELDMCCQTLCHKEVVYAYIKKLEEQNLKLKTMIRHAVAERTGVYFICGEAGAKDNVGLPEKVLMCPAFGSDGFAIYTKTSEYSAPGY